MRAIIVYESLFGTNRTIAEAIADGLGADADVTLVDAETAPSTIDGQLDLLVVGGPNHRFGLPRPATRADATADGETTRRAVERGLREWLEDLQLSRSGQPAAVWDTRRANPRFLDVVDHGSRSITTRLRRAGARMVVDAEHFYSADGKGALVEGERDRARAWGARLAAGR